MGELSESGNEYIRKKIYKKEISNLQIKKALTYLREHRIPYRVSIMFGVPEDTKKTANESIRFLRDIKPTIFNFVFYQPLPEIELVTKLGLNKDEIYRCTFFKEWSGPKIRTKELDIKDIKRLKRRFKILMIELLVLRGIEFKKFYFFLDILKYFLSPPGNLYSIIFSKDKFFWPHFVQVTMGKYVMERYSKKKTF